jgi:hypothetical protein
LAVVEVLEATTITLPPLFQDLLLEVELLGVMVTLDQALLVKVLQVEQLVARGMRVVAVELAVSEKVVAATRAQLVVQEKQAQF